MLFLPVLCKLQNQFGRGKGRVPTVKVDIGKAGTSDQADKVDSQMPYDDDNVVVENEST